MPAIELIIIYYFSTYHRVEVWQLFIVGFVLDIFYALPIGANSMILILANFILICFCKKLSLKEYTINVLTFISYAFFVIFMRYMIKSIIDSYIIDSKSIYFYFLTTILSYPILKKIIDKPLRAFS
jgi:cell shape-determining protein MreD